MALKISDYPAKTTIHLEDLLDFSNTEDSGLTYDESQKVTVQELLTYINNSGSIDNIYTANGTLLANRQVTSNTFYTRFIGGDVQIVMNDESTDYAFTVGDVSATERGRLGYDQATTSGNLVLSSIADGQWLTANAGRVGIGTFGISTSKFTVFNQNSLTNIAYFADTTNTKLFRITEAGVVSYTGIGVKMGIGTATPQSKFQVLTDNYLFNGTNDQIKISNNLGDLLTIKDGGGLEINNFQTGLGADLGTQDFLSHFLEYNFKSIRNSPNPLGKTHLFFKSSTANSAPYTRFGVNIENNTLDTLAQFNLDKVGAVQSASPTVVEILDNYGSHDVDLAGAERVKTGYKSDLNASFTTTTTGKGIVRSFWANAQGGDENQAIFIENGLIVSPNMPTSSVGLPTGALWNNGGVINIV